MVAGGYSGREYLSSTEIYDVTKEKWEIAGYMKNKRSDACSVNIGEGIWMMGGYDEGIYLNSCEIFSIEQGIWKGGPEMNKKREGPSATVPKQIIYVAGGWNGDSYDS